MTAISRMMSTFQSGVSQRQLSQNLSAELARTSREIATGRVSDSYAALGRGSAEAIAVRMEAERNEGFLGANKLLSGRLEVTSDALSGIRAAGQGVLDMAISANDGRAADIGALRTLAAAAIDSVANAAGISLGGTFLMSGTAGDQRPLRGWAEAAADTGQSPRDVIEGITGGTLVDAADAADKADRIAAVFSGTDPVRSNNFEGAFYAGTPALAGDGSASERVSTRVAGDTVLAHGVQANDPGVREILRGLSMLASVDPATVPDDAWSEWIGTAVKALSSGVDQVQSAEVKLGLQRAQLDDVITRQQDRVTLFATELDALEGVDGYEAATRLTQIQTQLEASYAVTARLSRMSFLNYMN